MTSLTRYNEEIENERALTYAPISKNVVGWTSGICDRKELWEARKAPVLGLNQNLSFIGVCIFVY